MRLWIYVLINAWLWAVLFLVLSLLASCAHEPPPPPALPDEPVRLEGFMSGAATPNAADEAGQACQEPPAPIIALTVQVCDQDRVQQARGARKGQGRRMASPAVPGAPPDKPLNLGQVITAGIKRAEVVPTSACYATQGAICHFEYVPGHVYTVYTHPSVATRIYVFRGDTVMTHPLLNLCQAQAQVQDADKEKCWEYGTARVGPEGAQQDVLAFRPASENTPSVLTGVDLESGRSLYIRLVVSKTPMPGVTWDMPARTQDTAPATGSLPAEPKQQHPQGQDGLGMEMPIELAQLHTAYKVEAKGPVGFLPTQVFDDGRKTVLRFTAIPGNMPTVFVYKPNGTRGLVYFTPYRVPGDTSRGTFYVVDQIWPRIELVGTDGQVVLITRITETPAVAVQVTR
jgi:type IV secretory pathway VirB9-like protein